MSFETERRIAAAALEAIQIDGVAMRTLTDAEETIRNLQRTGVLDLADRIRSVEEMVAVAARQCQSSATVIESAMRSIHQMSVLSQAYAVAVQNWLNIVPDDIVLRINKGIDRWKERHALVAAKLPKRGWYLTGDESTTLIMELADATEADRMDEVDDLMLENLPQLEPKAIRAILSESNYPEYIIGKLVAFLTAHNEGRFEESTHIGIPLIDTISGYVYGGKTFTTKNDRRGRNGVQNKPQIAYKSATAPEVREFMLGFVAEFGSLQEDCDPSRYEDEDYWNRSAIVHGHMKRPMGQKDSAKCLMAILFLTSSVKAEAIQNDVATES